MRGLMVDSTGADKSNPRSNSPRRCRTLTCAAAVRAAATAPLTGFFDEASYMERCSARSSAVSNKRTLQRAAPERSGMRMQPSPTVAVLASSVVPVAWSSPGTARRYW